MPNPNGSATALALALKDVIGEATDPMIEALAETESRLVEQIQATNAKIDTTNANMSEQFAAHERLHGGE